ncbi:MAG: enoyl-CoA hydratase [Brachymonas sp.]|nr:enoyl-CoA hydratase [Brachymonas sp.]
MPDILTHTEGGIATLTFNRLDKKNAITSAMYSEMVAFLQAAQADDAVRVAVFQGHEQVFSAGNDIADFLHNPAAGPEAPVMQFLHAISTFPKPLVAAVAGPAVGIGTTLLLHCDLVYAGDNAAFSMPFVNLGLCPEAGSSLLAPRLMGHVRAAEVLMLGEPFMAETALEMGLVNRVVPPGEVNALAQRQAAKLAAKPLQALMQTKRLMKSGQSAAVQQQIADEATTFARLLQSPEAKSAFAAFLQPR